jgi:UDP-N-acetylglucosamine 1-carboxyvinyltransferase
METFFVEGGRPLAGNVTPSGSVNSAIKLIYAALFSNEDVIIENVPDILAIDENLAVIRSVGAYAEWSGNNRLVVNGSGISTHEIPQGIGSRYKTTLLAAGPLLFRFGRAELPKFSGEASTVGAGYPDSDFIEAWEALGIVVEDRGEQYTLDSTRAQSTHYHFKNLSHLGTDNAVLTALFINGETQLTNASEESEVDDLITFCRTIGASIECPEPRKINITGVNVFKGGRFKVQSDKTEVAIFATAAITTGGNVTIQNVDRTTMVPFINFLNKIGGKFAFSGEELKIWVAEEILKPYQLEIAPTPGFVPAWQSLAVLILTQAEGESLVTDTVSSSKFIYATDLNRMGASIELVESEVQGIIESAKITGPSKLKATKLNMPGFAHVPVELLAALIAEGKSEVSGLENVTRYRENFIEKLTQLGAKVWKAQD